MLLYRPIFVIVSSQRPVKIFNHFLSLLTHIKMAADLKCLSGKIALITGNFLSCDKRVSYRDKTRIVHVPESPVQTPKCLFLLGLRQSTTNGRQSEPEAASFWCLSYF